MNDPIDVLVTLSRWLGDPQRDLAILGEGNTSIKLGADRIAVKASGAALGAVERDHFVEVDTHRILSVLRRDHITEAELAEHFAACCRTAGTRRPSIEVILHALAIDYADAHLVAHTHPVALNGLLCSDRADALVAGALFPDQIVVCGQHALLVPYADPGLPLARAVRDGLVAHLDRHAAPPKVIYLRNHGILVLGGTATEVRQITEMTVKVARILTTVLTVGKPTYLTESQAARIDDREDEHHRRAVLAQQALRR